MVSSTPNFLVLWWKMRLEGVSPAEIAAELVEAFKKIWGAGSTIETYGWGARMEDLLRNSLIALIETGLTLCDLPRLLIDEDFRENVLERLSIQLLRDILRDLIV